MQEITLNRDQAKSLVALGYRFQPACLSATKLGNRETRKQIYWLADRPYVTVNFKKGGSRNV